MRLEWNRFGGSSLPHVGSSRSYLHHVCYTVSMQRTIDILINDALQLPPEQRVTLAHRLLSSIEPKENVEALWDSEIQRRINAYDEGRSETIPAADVFETIAKRLTK